MKNEKWEKVERIFHTALDLSVEGRKPYLQRECTGDGELFSEVATLLDSFEQDSGFLDEPVFDLGLGAIGKKSQKNLAGATIGFYQVEEKIGAGGMSEVYKAVDTHLNRRVALKFLSASLENDNSAKRQLVREAQAVAMLEHPNICAIHGIEQTDEFNFIVMQYIEGITLAESIENATVGVEEFKLIARQIVTAVAFAHSHGMIHRDLKPGNIMLTTGGEIKVLDFGLAKVIQKTQIFEGEIDNNSNFSNNGLIIGTVSYMSPEQLRGERLDYRSDIFSIGIVLYELLAKKNPFNHTSQAETIAAILSDEPPVLGRFALNFPQHLVSLVEKCLQKKPNDRFQSASEILVELDTPESSNIVGSISQRRLRFLVKAALAAVFLMVVLAIIFFYNGNRPQRTLAVLPISFDNPPTEKEYLADGLTQSIIDKLSNLSDLKVKNQYLIAGFKGKTIEPQTVGKELNVDAVFAGTIQIRAGELFLVTKLLRTSDGFVIDTYKSKIEESGLIELQENIAARIIDKIKSNLTDDDKNKLAKKDTENEEAKRLYFLGRYYWSRREKEDLKNAILYFKDATKIDPYYAKAWAGLADAYALYSVPGNEGAISSEEAVTMAKAAAKNALEIDNSLCEPYTSLGLIKLRYEWDWASAETYFRISLSRNPEFAPAHFGLLQLLTVTGRFDEALAEAQKAKEFDPFSPSSNQNIGRVYYYKRDFEQMNKVLSESLESYPNQNRLLYLRGFQFLQTDKLKEATAIFEKIYESDKVLGSAPLGYVYGKAGRKEEAQKLLAGLEEISKQKYVPVQEKAFIYFGLGNFDKVFEIFNQACREKFPAFPFIVNDPLFDALKSDARFAEIKKCANL